MPRQKEKQIIEVLHPHSLANSHQAKAKTQPERHQERGHGEHTVPGHPALPGSDSFLLPTYEGPSWGRSGSHSHAQLNSYVPFELQCSNWKGKDTAPSRVRMKEGLNPSKSIVFP